MPMPVAIVDLGQHGAVEENTIRGGQASGESLALKRELSWDRMCRKQEEQQPYEEEHRNCRIGQSKGLQQSSLRSVVEVLYNRFHPNQYKQDLTAKPTGICGIRTV